MKTDKQRSYQDHADEYYQPRLNEILVEANKRKPVLKKLLYLFREKIAITEKLHTTAVNLQTPVKTNVVNAFETDTIHSYAEGVQPEEDMLQLRQDWPTKYGNYLDDQDPETSTVETFMEENEKDIPHEIAEAFKVEQTKNIYMVSTECLVGICYGMVLLDSHIENEIQEVLDNYNLSQDVLDEIAEKYGSKIRWNDTLPALAKLINMLAYASKIDIQNASAADKGKLAYMHFYVPVNSTGKEVSLASFKAPFVRTTNEAIDDFPKLQKLLKTIPYSG